ncbi:biotin/lipoate--protein ligase family protein [Alloyangia pacifica]|uniref:Biotin-(Acetyl-CoA carboxylase) ligase n=1 Tax=Alloyangia pacifica TaxID=311180 RepID=A0A1I6T608_9RHOB|nr:biotin/lipoate--protein ligase family protein [Alloyangia pacifica]SDG98998.1 Biotin-(acetyl-CoA carboxylase) ligase [Alloyangia pacifica]SFS84550.1 Biotin-(acetyl-CoA carboxylase) ligase [Alloyangia pacifica]
MSTTDDLAFPPLLWGEEVTTDAFDHACQRALLGCDAGLVAYRITASVLQGALVFAPEVPLAQAMSMLPLCGVGFQNALGVMAPPEVAVHLDWDGGIRVNGAACGRFRCMASTSDPAQVPDWLVIGFTLPLIPASDRPGDTPDQTSLYAEGCAEVQPPALLEAWARHTLNWVNRWEDDGSRALHADWRALVQDMGEEVTQNGLSGTFLGVDEEFGMLLRDGETTHLIPLTTILEPAP